MGWWYGDEKSFTTFLPWLLGWSYRKSHEIVGSIAGAQTNYQVRITVHYGSGTDSGEHVYLNGKCRTDFGDIRFTKSDGTTLLDYWMEEYVASDYAIFWVEVDSIPASPDTATIYIYYGNSDATTISNGDATFLFLDDFAGIEVEDWTKYEGNPILDVATGTWESQKVGDPWVIYNITGDGVYHMWYWGYDGVNAQIGYANSTDGINWVKYSGNPILTIGSPNSYDDKHAHKPSVVYKDGIYYMYYSAQKEGGNRTIALATSTSPTGPFTKYAGNPILEPTEPYEEGFLDCPSVMYDEQENIWKMWYSAGKSLSQEPEQWCYATSEDGYNWTKHPGNPIASPPHDGSWQSISLGGPNVLKINGVYYNYHNGFDDSGVSRIGYAISPDGINWDLNPSRLILDLGSPDSWDDAMVYRANVQIVNGERKLWYNAYDGTYERIGLANLTGIKRVLDANKWIEDVYGTGSVTVANGMVTIDETGGGTGNIRTIHSKTFTVPINVAVHTRVREEALYDNSYGEISPIIGEIDVFPFYLTTQNAQFMVSGDGTGRIIKHQSKSGGVWGTEDTIYGTTPTLNTWYRARWFKKSSSQTWYWLTDAETVLGSLMDNTDPPQGATTYYLTLGARGMKASWDWVFVRKYVDPEPSHGAWGAEESLS